MCGGRWALVMVLAGTLMNGQTDSAAQQLLAEGEKAAAERTKIGQQKALGLFERALKLAQASDDRPSEARSQYRLGQTTLFLGDAGMAVKHFDEAIRHSQALGLRVEETRARNNKAVALWQLGEAAQSLETYQTVLPLRRELQDRPGEALTLAGIANCYLTMGETEAALEHYRQSLAVWAALEDQGGIAESHNSIGNVLVQLSELDRAQYEFEQAQALWKQTGNRLRLLYVRNNLGWVAIGRRDFRRAQTQLEGLAPELELTGDRRAVAYVLHNLGSVYAGLGDLPRSRENFARSLEIKREIGDRVGAAYTLQALGEIARDPEETQRDWAEALAIRRDVPDANGLIITLSAFARLHRDLHDLPAARREMEEAIELIESRRAALVSQDLRATYFSRKRDYYEFLTGVLVDQGDTAAALAVAERARGRQLLDRVADSIGGLRQGIDPVLLARERRVHQAINAAVDRGAQPKLAALLRESHDVAEEIRRRSPRYASLVSPQPASAAEIQQLLAPGEVLVQYLLADERSFAFTVTRTTLAVDCLPGRASIESMVRILREAVTRRAAWSPAAARLRRVLLPRALPSRAKVVIAADGGLESLPFVLILPEGTEVAGLPSATALALRRSEKMPPSSRVDVLADPVFSATDSRLPAPSSSSPSARTRLRFSRNEAESIVALVPAVSCRLATDFAANRAFLQNASRSAVLHLATHTEVNSQEPELSGLALSQFDAQGHPVDGFVRLGEIFSLSLRARLVTLSACRSARGTDLPGEGLMSLTRGFLYAGAGAVLASLWDVDDRATAELMRRFYQAHLQRHLSPAAALRAAQTSLRAEQGWDHPYYWAAFTLQGEWR